MMPSKASSTARATNHTLLISPVLGKFFSTSVVLDTETEVDADSLVDSLDDSSLVAALAP